MASGSDEGDRGVIRSVRAIFARFARDEDGATALEYTLLSGFIGLALVGAMRTYSDKMVQVYQTLAAAMKLP